MSPVRILTNLKKLFPLRIIRNYSSKKIIVNKPQKTSSSQKAETSLTGDVPGFSSVVVKYGDEPVGPGASKNSDYKNPEYYCYHASSYFDAEIELLKYRCPQPDSRT